MAWRQAYITPIFKKGDRSDPKNYHPVSLTSIVCKTMEHVLVSQIMHHLETNNILVETQFGFRVSHSCESQLRTFNRDPTSRMPFISAGLEIQINNWIFLCVNLDHCS